MSADPELIERAIPDLVDSDALMPVVAAEIDFLAGRFARWTDRGGPLVRARAWAAAGDEARASALLSAMDVSGLDSHEIVAAAWAVSRVGPKSMAEALLCSLGTEPAFLFAGEVPLGPRALAEGPLVAAAGDLTGATDVLREAITVGDARAPVWGALARVELARIELCAAVLGDAGSADTLERANRLLSAGLLFFRAGGYRSLFLRSGQLTHPDRHAPLLGGPTIGRLRPGRPWMVGFGVMGDAPLRESRGLVMIRHLVQHPGRPIPAIVLDILAKGGDIEPIVEAAADLRERDDCRPGEIRALLSDEAVRSRVGKSLSRTVERIGDDHPLLARHLRSTLRTGHVCRYEPPTDLPVIWAI